MSKWPSPTLTLSRDNGLEGHQPYPITHRGERVSHHDDDDDDDVLCGQENQSARGVREQRGGSETDAKRPIIMCMSHIRIVEKLPGSSTTESQLFSKSGFKRPSDPIEDGLPLIMTQ